MKDRYLDTQDVKLSENIFDQEFGYHLIYKWKFN